MDTSDSGTVYLRDLSALPIEVTTDHTKLASIVLAGSTAAPTLTESLVGGTANQALAANNTGKPDYSSHVFPVYRVDDSQSSTTY